MILLYMYKQAKFAKLKYRNYPKDLTLESLNQLIEHHSLPIDDDRDTKERPFNGTTDRRNKCESIDDGTSAFMQWLNSEDKKSTDSGNPLILLKFVNDKHTIIHDSLLGLKIDVESHDGIPFCGYCKSDDCAHVGFTICVEQLYGHRRGGSEVTLDDLLES
jgi:hypothetical protein